MWQLRLLQLIRSKKSQPLKRGMFRSRKIKKQFRLEFRNSTYSSARLAFLKITGGCSVLASFSRLLWRRQQILSSSTINISKLGGNLGLYMNFFRFPHYVPDDAIKLICRGANVIQYLLSRHFFIVLMLQKM